jgi:hypothetical protein
MQIMFKVFICSSVYILMILQPCGAAGKHFVILQSSTFLVPFFVDDCQSSSFGNSNGNASCSWGQDTNVASYDCHDSHHIAEPSYLGTWAETTGKRF